MLGCPVVVVVVVVSVVVVVAVVVERFSSDRETVTVEVYTVTPN